MRSLKALLLLVASAAVVAASCLLLFDDDAPIVAPAAVVAPHAEVAHVVSVNEAAPDVSREAVAPTSDGQSPIVSAGSAHETERSFAGRVVDQRGEAVANATVYVASSERSGDVPVENLDPTQLAWARRADATTDATGRFRIALVSAGSTRLGVRARGFAPHDRTLSNLDALQDVGDVVVDDSVVLSGRVLDPARRPVAGALVRRLDPDARSAVILGPSMGDVVATTDVDGAFRVDEVGSGRWMLLIRAEGHPDKLERGETSRPGQIVDGLELVLEDGAEIRGRVVRAPPEVLRELWVRAVPVRATGRDPVYAGAPIDEAALLVVPRSARCAADGSFVVRGLTREAAYRLSGREGENDLLGSARTTWVDARAGAGGVELVYEPPTTIVFRAVDAATSEPVTDLVVIAPGASYAFDRDRGQHRVRLRAEPGRTVGMDDETLDLYALLIDARGYEPVLREDARRPIVGRELDLGVIRLSRAPMLTVRVVDGATGEPVVRARVVLSSESREESDLPPIEEFTDGSGRAELRNLGAKLSLLGVAHPAYAPYRGATATREGETTVRLSAGGSVVVEVRDALGAVVPSIPIEHVCANDEMELWVLHAFGEARTDELGQVTFARLSAGPHRFRLGDRPDGAQGEVAVADGVTQTLVLTVPMRGRLSGRVIEGGQPLSGATLRLVQRGVVRYELTVRTNGQGEFALNSLELGEYDVHLTHPARAMAFDRSVGVTDVHNRLDIDLPLVAIEGRVVDEEDRPLAGIRLRAESASGGGAGDARVQSDADGRYVLSGVLTDADVVVHAESEHHQPAQSPVLRVSPGQRVSRVDLKLVAGARLDVTIVHADGRAVGSSFVRAEFDGSGTSQIAVADARGVAHLRGLRPGSWRVRVDSGPEGTSAAEQIVEVRLGASNVARLELR